MMTPRDRTKAAWCFLSQDYTSRFFRELWVPVSEIPQFQAGVRKQLAAWLTEEKYHKEGEALAYSVAEWYENTYGSDALDILFLWMREIYLFHGPDRIAETVWKIVPYRADDVAAEFPVRRWLFELLGKVRQAQEKRTTLLDNKLDQPTPLSNWDANLLAIQYGSEEGLETKISLIGSYNIFLESWEKHCSGLGFEELQSIFEIGKRVAEMREIHDSDVVFPGSWRFELRKLLALFTGDTTPSLRDSEI